MGTVYLLHIFGVLPNHVVRGTRRRTAMHYIGFTAYRTPRKRVRLHRAGTSGSKYMRACYEQGFRFHLVRTWRGTRDFERALKRQHNAARLCPHCRRSKGGRT